MLNMTFGYELELGDILRSRKLPSNFGSWEYAETDIVNLLDPYKYVACDPLGISPPMGGEINIRPGHTAQEVAARVSDTISWFRSQGDSPTASCVNHGHVHVRALGVRDNIELLKKLTNWIVKNQEFLVRHAYGFAWDPLMAKTRTARSYLKWDGGRLMPVWMGENIDSRASNFDDFIRLQCCGVDGTSRGRPLRYAINTYCLKHTDTIEFRLFRASVKYEEILGSIQLAEACIRAALDSGESAEELMSRNNFALPPFLYDHEAYLGWERSKWSKERGKKQRTLIEL